MKKRNQMIAGAAALLAGIAVLAGSTRCQAAGNTYDTAVDAAFGETFTSLFYEKVAGSPLEVSSGASGGDMDGVDTASGHLVISRTDLSLEGTGGMDFELNRYYDSNEAIIGMPTTETVDELEIHTKEVHYKTHDGEDRKLYVSAALLKKHKKALKDLMGSYTVSDYLDRTESNTQRTKILSREDSNVYGLASGWKFDLPWIETVTIAEKDGEQWGARPAYLHFGSIGTMEIGTRAKEGDHTYEITGLTDYPYSDVRLEDWNKTVDGTACRFLLRDKTGLRTYFNEDGVVVLQKDSHDNTIRYTYTDKIYLKSVTDSVGREIQFHYEEGDEVKQLASVTVEGKDTAGIGGVSKKTIRYTYEERSYTPLNSDPVSGLVLKSATVDGSKETYGYRTVERLMTTCGYGAASQRVSTNENYLLNKVTSDGSIQHYEYRPKLIRGEKKEKLVVQGYYVTREYTEDQKTKKKSDGLKYDFFQLRSGTLLRFCDYYEGHDEIRPYGWDGIRNAVIVSRFNPNKYKANKTMSDYIYKKSQINTKTLHLKKDTKKDVSVYIYNSGKMLEEEVEYGKVKEETLYSYDNGGKGSLVVQETDKVYGKRGDKAVTVKRGYTYDGYRNVLTEKTPRAFYAKNKGKEHLYSAAYTYQGTESGYPDGDTALVCFLVTEESYTSASTKNKLVKSIAPNGIDIASISEQRSVGGGEYNTIYKTEFLYDEHGNETQKKDYPSYSTDGEKEIIQNDYAYNSLGQQTKSTVTLTSAKRPADNRTYTEEEITYDSFGNELTYEDENGLVSKMFYDSETGEEAETINAVGTEYESKDQEYQSDDGLKTMTVDEYGRITINIQDAFGNTIISKDEAAGTWTESIYDYGSGDEDGGDSEDSSDGDTEDEKEETIRLIEERTYTFEPDEKRFIVNENGETVPNFYITGKGKQILSGSRHFYDDLGNEIGSAEFSNGELDAAHCTSWSFNRSETEVTGDEDEAQTISTSYSKTLDPARYQPEADAVNYYDQFNDGVLSENITKTVTDAGGNTLSQTSTDIRGKNTLETLITYENDDFGRTVKESTVTRKQQAGTWLSAYETQTLYTYDDNGNVSQTDTKSRKEGEADWQSRTVKTDYDGQGQVIGEYTPRGTEENVATKYEYDILGRMIQSEIPQEMKDGSIQYQKTSTKYDKAGNVSEKEEQMDSDRTARTEYDYDKRGNLVMVKNCLEDGKAQYVQYVYDIQGNKVRQFTGMTEPLTLMVTEIADAVGDTYLDETDNAEDTVTDGREVQDVFSYAGKTYKISVSGQKKSDDIRETKYEYDGKNQLVAFIDPEGRRETYTYDINGNLTKMVDKNGNTHTNKYDYQNRLTETLADLSAKGQRKKTETETKHIYTYNKYGDVATQDETSFEYDDASGQVTKETTKLTKNKDVVKKYTYDSAGNRSVFSVQVGNDTKLSLQYTYDGASRLSSVTDEKGDQVVDYSYDADGNLAERNVPGNHLKTTYTYDYQNRLTAMKNQTDSAGVISEYSSKYLANGQKSQENSDTADEEGRKTKKTATYTYDLLGRIQKETKTGREDISYTYDSNNNRKEMKTGKRITAYKYNKNDELLRTDTLHTDTEKDSVVIYKNDRNGNQLATVNRYEIPSDRKDNTYVDVDVTLGDNRLNENVVNRYNAQNELTQTLTRNYKVSFTYDAEGLRTSKTVNGEKTVFVWDGDQLVLELTESGKVQKRYVRGNELVYFDEGERTDSDQVKQKQYYVTDPHGNVVQLTDGNGNVTRVYEYDSFGNELEQDGRDDNPFRYCGEYFDKETGEVYLRARYYQPIVGRFLTRDTYTGEEDEALSLHLYTYCQNDGVNGIDPSGHWNKKVHQGMTEVVAETIGFSQQEARIIAIASRKADNVYKNNKWQVNIGGTVVTVGDLQGMVTKVSHSSTYKGKGVYKVKLHGPDQKEYEKGVTKGFITEKVKLLKNNRKKTLAVVGLWLHQLQDRWSHGVNGCRKHKKGKTDNFHYDYRNGKYVKVKAEKIADKLSSNVRVYNTVKVTVRYLLNAKSVIGTENTSGTSEKENVLAKRARKKAMYYLWGISEVKLVPQLIQMSS